MLLLSSINDFVYSAILFKSYCATLLTHYCMTNYILSIFLVLKSLGCMRKGVQQNQFSCQSLTFMKYYFFMIAAVCDPVQDVETIFHLSYLLTASGNLS